MKKEKRKARMTRKTAKKVGLILLIIILDFMTKIFLEGKSIALINGVIRFESVHNTGAAWSMLDGHIGLFVLFAVLFVMVVFLVDHKLKLENKWYFWGTVLMLAGAIANAFDRVVYGYVRDFIKLEFISFPIFNIADMALVIGTVLVSVFILFIYKPEEKKA